jgi:hypothetical protein
MRSKIASQVHALLLVLVWVGLTVSSCQASARGRVHMKKLAGVADVAIKFRLRVVKPGVDKAASERLALKEARGRLNAILRSQEPPIEWTPRESDVRKLLKGDAEVVKTFPKKVSGYRVTVWRWTFDITDQEWQEILRHDREGRALERMALMGKVLAGLVALLALVACYIRLDEWTRGYYTGRLRLVAGGLLALVGAGLWWLS